MKRQILTDKDFEGVIPSDVATIVRNQNGVWQVVIDFNKKEERKNNNK